MQWLFPLAMGAWAIWTWTLDQKKERERERRRMAALFVNPYLSACEDLQYRIYRVLEGDGLRDLQRLAGDHQPPRALHP